ncbi:hypothetical protein QP907_00100 [Corynebacterium pseudodiphtheriticum]|uniref:hypothetical protein n=1 Tax=Corynebacterium pseudodiphtheriticum TaxID=37637 RepID=UPI00254CDA2D|nr:hypothetical protein [Corynebacterium pseudodiphtheriticum]MDK8550728.1 hypothetical protein [Corynebacterium pseudodiphtheriticum]
MEENKTSCPQRDPLCGEKSARRYCGINIFLAGLLALPIAAGIIVPISDEKHSSVELIPIIVVFVFYFLIHLWRAIWLCEALKKELKIVEDAAAYEMERIAFLAWVGVFLLTLYRYCIDPNEDLSSVKVISDWLISLLLLSPIVTLVGPGWGKLYVESPNGKISWPKCLKSCTKQNCDVESTSDIAR